MSEIKRSAKLNQFPGLNEAFQELKKARLRYKGGGELSELEHKKIDEATSKMAVDLYTAGIPVDLAIQSLVELTFVGLAKKAKDEKDFMQIVYNFMKDYFYPQAEKLKAPLIKYHVEHRKISKEELRASISETVVEGMQVDLQGGVVISGTMEEVLEKLSDLMGPGGASDKDDCPCPVCVERRKREEIERNTPNPNTKH